MKRVLVVDDTRSLVKGLSEILTFEGFGVMEAFDGLQAYELFAENPPDLVITDLRMPKMDGFQLITKIRQDSKYNSIPIIVLTASVGMDSKEKVLQMGVSKFIAKPFDDEELVNIIKSMLSE